MYTVALIEPQIPPNTGNIARLCAATNMELVVVGQLGFPWSDRHLKRAGMDYWEFVRIRYEPDFNRFLRSLTMERTYFLTTKTERAYTEIEPQRGDTFLFGSETSGLPGWLLKAYPDSCLTIPMPNPNVRSLNLATSCGIVMYHMLAQAGFE